MKCGPAADCSQRDLVGSRLALLVWCLPTVLIVAGIFLPVARSALWIPSFTVMGVACLANARRCRRLHCHLTGPLFLLAAIVTVLDALAITGVGWKLSIGVTGLGTGFAYGLEWVLGKYVKVPPPSAP